jgi:subtilisin family serine protease
MVFQPDGTAITPGNVLFNTSGGLLLSKPDFAAADGVPTGLSSFNPFYGTSAAVPHAAAIAALMLQSNPSITLAGMRAALSASAITAGPDSGAGIVVAPAAIAQAPRKCSYSVSSAGDAYSSAPGTGSITVSTRQFACGPFPRATRGLF